MLRLANIIPGKWSLQPTAEQLAAGLTDEWAEFRNLYNEMKVRRLDEDEWNLFKDKFARLASEVVHRARIITCTPPVVDSKLFKAKHFDDMINDETSVTTSLELLCAWRQIENLVLIGDRWRQEVERETGKDTRARRLQSYESSHMKLRPRPGGRALAKKSGNPDRKRKASADGLVAGPAKTRKMDKNILTVTLRGRGRPRVSVVVPLALRVCSFLSYLSIDEAMISSWHHPSSPDTRRTLFTR